MRVLDISANAIIANMVVVDSSQAQALFPAFLIFYKINSIGAIKKQGNTLHIYLQVFS